MARKKSYDEKDVIEKALSTFWREGYEGTSTRMLEKEMGINQFSIYSSFENKNQNHVLTIDDSQLDTQKKSNTRWLLDIDLKSILTEFVFANVKKERTIRLCYSNW